MAKNQKSSHSSKPNPDKSNSFAKYSGLAFEVAAFNLICIWGGYELSLRFSPKTYWILISAILLAVAGTIWYLLKRLIE